MKTQRGQRIQGIFCDFLIPQEVQLERPYGLEDKMNMKWILPIYESFQCIFEWLFNFPTLIDSEKCRNTENAACREIRWVVFHKIFVTPLYKIHKNSKNNFLEAYTHDLPFQMIPAPILLKVQIGKDLPSHVLPLHDVWLQFLWCCLPPVDTNKKGKKSQSYFLQL